MSRAEKLKTLTDGLTDKATKGGNGENCSMQQKILRDDPTNGSQLLYSHLQNRKVYCCKSFSETLVQHRVCRHLQRQGSHIPSSWNGSFFRSSHCRNSKLSMDSTDHLV